MRHLNTMIRGFAALLISLLFVVGVPAGLVAYVGWPLPTSLPTLDQIQIAFRSGIDPQLLINALAVVVWIVWAQLVVTLATEVVAAVRGRTARRLPVLPGLQPAVAQLVAAITLAAATLGPLRAGPSHGDSASSRVHSGVQLSGCGLGSRDIEARWRSPPNRTRPNLTNPHTG